MRCKYCGYDVNPTNMPLEGVCSGCTVLVGLLNSATLTSNALTRILKDIRPEEKWVATWGKAVA